VKDLFGNILDNLVDTTKGIAVNALPKCNICDETALILPCVACGEYACMTHAFVNMKSLRLICGECAEALDIEFDDEEEPQVADVDEEKRAWAFSVLGLKEGATKKEIKSRYRELSKRYHPDHNPEGVHIFKDVTKAYEVLK